jgi:hypothetical protein
MDFHLIYGSLHLYRVPRTDYRIEIRKERSRTSFALRSAMNEQRGAGSECPTLAVGDLGCGGCGWIGLKKNRECFPGE